MESKYFLYAGGVYHLCWAAFDSFWPIIFDWKKRLSSLDDFHRVLPYIVSRCLVILYLMLTFISFFHTSELLQSGLGKIMLYFVSIYWTLRFVMQVQYMSIKKMSNFNIKVGDTRLPWPVRELSNQSLAILVFFIMAAGVALYLIPALRA